MCTERGQELFGEDVAAAEDAGRVEGALELRHLAQGRLAVEGAQVLALDLADGALDEAAVGRARGRLFGVVAREDVDVDVVVADVAEDDVRQTARAQRLL